MNFRSLITLVAAGALITTTVNTHAANWLVGAQETDRKDGITDITVNLGQPLHLTSPFKQTGKQEYRATAKLDNQVEERDWQFIELNFDEHARVLKKVALQGSKQKGFEVRIYFDAPMVVATKPQLSLRTLSFVALPPATHRRISNFGGPTDDRVAIQLSHNGMLTTSSLPKAILQNKSVYAVPEQAGQYRVGFYPTQTAASVALRALRGRYPDARLVDVAVKEPAYAEVLSLFPSAPKSRPAQQVKEPGMLAVAVTPATIDEEEKTPEVAVAFAETLDRSVLDDAREAYLDKDWPRAIALYNKAAKESALREHALELLGVARQRNHQLAHAKSVYQSFLNEFPDSDNYSRVQQRLNSLTGNDRQATNLRMPKSKSQAAWQTTAVLSQFYRRHTLDVDGADKRIPIDAIFSDGTAIARRHSENGFHEARISVGHIQDLDSENDQRSFRLQRVHWESFFERFNTGFKVGRQSANKSGVLSRVDGATLYYQATESLRLNVLGGYVADSTYDSRDADRTLYGMSADWELLDGKMEISPFFIQQNYDGILDRRAVGTHFYWMTKRSQMMALADYDTHHQALNNLYVNASYDLNDIWRVNGAYDHRRSPYLTTSNALIGQQYDDLSELERDLVDLKLGDIADDRTATSSTIRLGVDGRFDNTWSLSMDVSSATYSSTDSSAGVIGIPERTDYYFSSQLRADNLIGSNTYSAVQMRYQVSENASTSTLFLTNRFSVFSDWFIYPRVVAAQRVYDDSDLEQLQLRPSLRVDYRGFDRFNLEAELGYDWTTRESAGDDIDMTGAFFRLGYRARF